MLRVIWSEKQIDLLRKGCAEGMSYSLLAAEINRETGSQFTRNACIGKAQRIGCRVVQRLRNPHVEARKVQRRRPKGAPRPRLLDGSLLPDLQTVEAYEESAPPAEFLGIAFMDLEPGHCRFPRGENPILFCGQPKMQESSYCRDCHRIVYAPPKTRNVSDEERDRRRARAKFNFHRSREAAA
jgi:hypothetical protein